MKKLLSIFVFILAFTHVIGQSFTGIIKFETENFELGEKSSIQCYLKAGKCKMEFNSTTKEGNNTYVMYFDNNKSDVTILFGGNKTSVAASSLSANKYFENILVAVASGRSQNIAGYDAKEVNLKSTNASIRCLVANELVAEFPGILSGKGIIKALRENNITGTPVLIEVKDLAGNLLFVQKIVSVSQQDLNDSIFISE